MNLRPLLFVPPVALGVLGFLWMTSERDTPVETAEEATVAVRTVVLAPQSVAAVAVGYGRVEAERSWAAVSEVQGRVTTLASGIAEGSIVEAGHILIEVDGTDYELARQKALANIGAAEAQLAELARSEENTRRTLEVQENILAVAQAEFDRVQSLVGRGTSTEAALDTTRKTLLAQEASVINLNNTLALYPVQRVSAEATLKVRRAELAEAERSLDKTTIAAPFAGRVTAVNVEQGQFVRTGDTLVTLDSTDAVEITAEVQPRAFQPLVVTTLGPQAGLENIVDTRKAISLIAQAGISASVSLSVPESDAVWSADIVRLRGAMDDETGAMGLVVRVADPLLAAPSQGRPPLSPGTFVTVTFTSPPRDGLLAIPRDALHYSDLGAAFVYLADAENRLEIRDVQTGPVIGSDVIISAGVSFGDILVLSDPRPPIPGLKLDQVLVTPAAQGN